jgi:hypothetical protein
LPTPDITWHANQMARYNILKGMKPPESGQWRNNPDADDITSDRIRLHRAHVARHAEHGS